MVGGNGWGKWWVGGCIIGLPIPIEVQYLNNNFRRTYAI